MKHHLLTTIAAVVLVGCGTTQSTEPPKAKASDWSIYEAARFGKIEAVKQHIAAGVDVNAKQKYTGRTPLDRAAEGGHKEIAELLIEKGADVNAKKEDGQTPLYSAALYSHKEIVELLIANGAEVNAKNKYGETPLNLSFVGETADLLRKHGGKTKKELEAAGKPTEPVAEAATPEPPTAKAPDISIHDAVEKGNIEAVKQHLTAGTDVNARDSIGETPLFYAAVDGHKEIAELLIAEGADVNAEGHFRETPLHKAVVMGHKKVTELLIAEGADVNAKADESLLFEGGSTPLHYATLRNNTEMVELLIAEGADVNAKGDYGNTPLFDAARQGHKEIAELLIDEGADVNAQYYRGDRRLTPLDKAKEKVSWDSLETKATKKEIADLLHEHGAKTFEELRVLIPRLSFTRSPFGFTFNTIEGKTYWVESGMDLKKWNKIREIKGTGNEAKFIDMRRIYFPQHFYRLMVVD